MDRESRNQKRSATAPRDHEALVSCSEEGVPVKTRHGNAERRDEGDFDRHARQLFECDRLAERTSISRRYGDGERLPERQALDGSVSPQHAVRAERDGKIGVKEEAR